jgi:hypothetical protein
MSTMKRANKNRVKSQAKKKPPKVPHTTSHLRPTTPDHTKKGGSTVHVKTGVEVREYPGEGKHRGGNPFGSGKVVTTHGG